jgi:cobyrinic acid a,c-diamide synthase
MKSTLISSTKKSSGKTIVSIGLAGLARELGYTTQTFKKGPDFIDPSWLAAASKTPCYNLDFNTMNNKELLLNYRNKSRNIDFSLIEGTKGLFDGVSTSGQDSNAELAKILNVEIILVIDCNGMTRGIAPLLLGYSKFDEKLKIKNIILNNVSTSRHEIKLISAVKEYTNLKIIGSTPLIKNMINERHLGLIPAFQHPNKGKIIRNLTTMIKNNIDYKKIYPKHKNETIKVSPHKIPLKNKHSMTIGVAKDSAFGFYYEDDLENIRALGHKVKFINLIKDKSLPKINALFIGGGFPETEAKKLESNINMRKFIKKLIEDNLPVYAECGGLMYLCKRLKYENNTNKMCNVFDIDINMNDKPIGRGYTVLQPQSHPWGIKNSKIHAHEFHYSSLVNGKKNYNYAFDIKRGYGINGKVDGLIYKNTVASFSHLRSTDAFNWVEYFIKFVEKVNGTTNF